MYPPTRYRAAEVTTGIAQTKRRDIAELADTTPGHVRYYLNDTRTLWWYFAATCNQFNSG